MESLLPFTVFEPGSYCNILGPGSFFVFESMERDVARLITINGPLGVGKTWTVNKLKEYFGVQGVTFIDVNMQEPIKQLAYQLLDLPSSYSYDQMKMTRFMGFTGREWIIKISESMKDLRPTIWVDKSLNKITDDGYLTGRNDIYIIDSQGFEVEMNPISEWGRLEVNEVIQIGIEPPDKRHLRGQKWQADDSRYNLCHLLPSSNVVTDSNEAYWLLKNKIQSMGWV